MMLMNLLVFNCFSLLFHIALPKMTTPSNPPVDDQDCIKLENLEDQVSDGRFFTFIRGWLDAVHAKC